MPRVWGLTFLSKHQCTMNIKSPPCSISESESQNYYYNTMYNPGQQVFLYCFCRTTVFPIDDDANALHSFENIIPVLWYRRNRTTPQLVRIVVTIVYQAPKKRILLELLFSVMMKLICFHLRRNSLSYGIRVVYIRKKKKSKLGG